jgi:hypothetical protein
VRDQRTAPYRHSFPAWPPEHPGDVAVMLKLSGRDPVITAENERWLHRLGALMLDRFGIGTGRETTEENDG